MRQLILLTGLLALGDAMAQERECPKDMTGIQTTARVTDSNGNPYEISHDSRNARDTQQFLHAALNYMYFSNEGSDLRDEFVNYMRVRDAPILIASCNNRGQCAEIEVRSRPLVWAGFVGLVVHSGFDVTARFDGELETDFIPIDSYVHWNRIPPPNERTTGCLRNDERDATANDTGGEGEHDGVDDPPVDIDFDEEVPDIEIDFPVGEVDIIDPDEDGNYPDMQEL